MKFTEEHEWLEPDGETVKVGITEYAAEQLGDIVFIELPEVGTSVTKGQEIVVIESVKAFTLSITTISCPLVTEVPTSGSSMNTISPNCSAAYSVIPTLTVSPSGSSHSCSSVNFIILSPFNFF